MNNDTLPVSVIIPNYNSGSFLPECIRSVNSGKFPAEILIIDDCSNDDSPKLALTLQKQFYNIKILNCAVNAGAAAARKLGLDSATQKYVAFIDADDILEVDALELAYEAITLQNADMCIWELWNFNVTSRVQSDANPDQLPLTGKEAVKLTFADWKMHAAGVSLASLYKTAYQDFTENYFNSDELITRLALSHATKIIGCKKKYFYRLHDKSATKTLHLRRLGSLHTCLWLSNFSHNHDGSFAGKILLNGVREARYFWRNRKIIGESETFISLNDFIKKIETYPRIINIFVRSPKLCFTFFYLKINIFLFK